MLTKASDLVFVLHILFEGCCVISQLTTKPLNAAGKVEDQIIFNCSSSSGAVPGWQFSQDGVNFQTISSIGLCAPAPNVTQFKFEKFGTDTCNVIIDNATTSEAGAYKCIDPSLTEWNAQFTVVESISVSVTPNNSNAVKDEPTNMTCTVTFGAASSPPFPMLPSIIWTNTADGANINGTGTKQTPSRITSYIIVIPTSQAVPPYSCIAYFKTFAVGGNWASNIPTYNVSQNTPELPVLYGPIVITSDFTNYCQFGTFTLTCNASSNPSVEFYTWKDTATNIIIANESIVTLSTGGRYECSAYNTIRGNITWSSWAVADVKVDIVCVYVPTAVISSNLIAMITFIICYACCTNFRQRVNDRFDELKRMLPCLNDEESKCSGWIFLFIIVSVFAGIFYFPIIVIMAYCCPKEKLSSQGRDQELNKRKPDGPKPNQEQQRNKRQRTEDNQNGLNTTDTSEHRSTPPSEKPRPLPQPNSSSGANAGEFISSKP